METNKIKAVFNRIKEKTEKMEIKWERLSYDITKEDRFVTTYLEENISFGWDCINSFYCVYNKGYIYLISNGYSYILAVQPTNNTALTTLNPISKDDLAMLKKIIEGIIDSPDDFLDSLI